MHLSLLKSKYSSNTKKMYLHCMLAENRVISMYSLSGYLSKRIVNLLRLVMLASTLSKILANSLKWMFRDPDLRRKTTDEDLIYYTRSRINKLVGIIITSIIFILLVLPVVAMYKLTASAQTLSQYSVPLEFL